MYKKCLICQSSFRVPPCRFEKAKTCSKSCSAKLSGMSRKVDRLVLSCKNCGKEVLRLKCQIESKYVYCSRSCHNSNKTVHLYKCINCGKGFHRPIRKNQTKPTFCSRKCMWKVRRVVQNPPNCICIYCGGLIHKSKSHILAGEGIYCSKDCKRLFAIGRNMRQYSPARYPHYYNQPLWRSLRKVIIKRDNNLCTSCGYKPVKISVLHVHHIKRRLQGGSDSPENLITLCRSCHKRIEG